MQLSVRAFAVCGRIVYKLRNFSALRHGLLVEERGSGMVGWGPVDASVYGVNHIARVCLLSRLFGSLSDRIRAVSAKAVSSVNEASRP